MTSKYLAAALLCTALTSNFAYAENAADKSDKTVSLHREGEVRASKLAGVNVYNQANEKIGEVVDVILDKSGRADQAVLSVGGFLGVGEHRVAVSFDKLKWVNQPVASTTSSNDKNATKDQTTGQANSRQVRASDEKWYPDHAVLNATKDQLKAMPQFKFN